MKHHNNVHYTLSEWSEESTLYVAACYSNPFRWETRRKITHDFLHHMSKTPNIKLYFVELAYGDRPHEFDPYEFPNIEFIQLRTDCELFHKENMLNCAITRFPQEWKYGAIVDADFHFIRHDWALEAIHQLQHYSFVQLYSHYSDLSSPNLRGGGYKPIGITPSFAYLYHKNHCKLLMDDTGNYLRSNVGAVGGPWAFTKEAFNTIGGLPDKCILGAGDWFMAFGIAGTMAPGVRIAQYGYELKRYLNIWVDRAKKLKANFGYIDNYATHAFHGSKTRRFYYERDQILITHKFDPYVDIYSDWQGIYRLNDNKPELRDAIRDYFLSRTEDDPNLYGYEKGKEEVK